MIRRAFNNNETGGSRAFTLLEVMLAVAIIAMITVVLYRFVQTNLMAIQANMENASERQSVVGLVDFVRTQMAQLPPRGDGIFLGAAYKFSDMPSDEMQWSCQAGEGLLTTAAEEDYVVTLAIQPAKDNPKEREIGLRRRPASADEKNYNWLPLLRPAAAMEIRYFDSRLNAPLERWNDQNARPSFVRIKIWRRAGEPPYEAVLRVPSANVNAQ